MPNNRGEQNYAIRTLKERLDYVTLRSKPGRPNTEKHVAELTAAIKILEKETTDVS